MKYAKPKDISTIRLELDVEELPFVPEKMSMARLRKIKLIPDDFKLAARFQKKQRLKNVTLESLFHDGFLYSMLSANESYNNQMRALNQLDRACLNNPQAILNDEGTLKEIVGLTMYGNQRSERILRFCNEWIESSLPQKILYDSVNGKVLEFVLRDEMKKQFSGIGLKTASLILNTLDYENVVPIDKWVIRYLFAHRLIKKDPTIRNRKQSGGISDGMYRKCEKIIQNRAKEIGVSPLNYQLAIWVANSRTGGDMNYQTKIGF